MKALSVLHTSRPRFWMYTLGPFLIGVVMANALPTTVASWIILIATAVFFTFPANFFIYGINDVFDYETDLLNPKKKQYEKLLQPDEHKLTIRLNSIILFGAILASYVWFSGNARLALLAFFVLSYFYSAPPIRAKSKPFVDTFFNALYVVPGIVGFYVAGGSQVSSRIVIAGILWCMAMHAYSAIPDIDSDTKAKIKTIATVLKKNTLVFCIFCYFLASWLIFPLSPLLAIFLTLVYGSMIVISWMRFEHIERLYTWFPAINTLFGLCVFIVVLVIQKL